MEFVHKDNRFTLISHNYEVGFLAYGIVDDIFYINGIVVDEMYRGQGLAKVILDEAVAYVRGNNLKAIPRCSYAVAKFSEGGYEDIQVK